jgi:glycopeptide antibiotics resistance protein
MDATRPAIVAIVFGVVIAIGLFVPFVAIQYRRRGRLTFGSAALSFIGLVYALALASYTLLPLPAVNAQLCADGGAGIQLNPLQFVSDIARVNVGGVGGLLHNPALWQVLLNVALFVPFGVLFRYLTRRGIAITAAAGLVGSLLIETTQLTGDWFLFPCAYRLFDVDDLLANTAGAVLGAVIAPAFGALRQRSVSEPAAARPVGGVRRLLGFISDVLFVVLLGGSLDVAAALLANLTTGKATLPEWLSSLFGYLVPGLVELAVLLFTRRSIGEWVVRLRPVQPTSVPRTIVRWLLGIGGFALLSLIEGGSGGLLGGALVLLSFILALTTRGHRGLAFAVVGWTVVDDRLTVSPHDS